MVDRHTDDSGTGRGPARRRSSERTSARATVATLRPRRLRDLRATCCRGGAGRSDASPSSHNGGIGLPFSPQSDSNFLSAEKHDHWRRRSRSEWTVLSARSMIGRIGPPKRRSGSPSLHLTLTDVSACSSHWSVSGIRFSEPVRDSPGRPLTLLPEVLRRPRRPLDANLDGCPPDPVDRMGTVRAPRIRSKEVR
jgi:hypothetical protein